MFTQEKSTGEITAELNGTQKLLQRALDLLNRPGIWCNQNPFAFRDKTDPCGPDDPQCMATALSYVGGAHHDRPPMLPALVRAFELLDRAVGGTGNISSGRIIAYNDSPGRTLAEVQTAYRTAIRLAGARQ